MLFQSSDCVSGTMYLMTDRLKPISLEDMTIEQDLEEGGGHDRQIQTSETPKLVGNGLQ